MENWLYHAATRRFSLCFCLRRAVRPVFPLRSLRRESAGSAFRRTGTDFNDLNRQKEFLRKTYRAACFLFEEKPIAVSSTEIREQLRNRQSFEYLPAAVAEYIKEKGFPVVFHIGILPVRCGEICHEQDFFQQR